MPEHVYKLIEMVGSSEQSIEHAIETAIEKVHESIRHLRWFEVMETRGHIEHGKVKHYQVTLKAGFTFDEEP